ncbi:MAG TPA: hypothetical protein VN918_10110 [Myxococcaceae bacterium]|nr:hypothetical protein [Myxococcaceae bacterium]
MPMLACIHYVSWVVPIDGGKHQCLYCRETVTKKDIYPKFEDLGLDYQTRWDRHEKGEVAAPAPAKQDAST